MKKAKSDKAKKKAKKGLKKARQQYKKLSASLPGLKASYDSACAGARVKPFYGGRGAGPPEELGPHERVEPSVEHPLDVADLGVGAVVLDHRVGVQHVRADL